jgi:hypothetical protein
MENVFSDALNVLGLGPRATAEEIKEAHRDLTKVWHPDRFGNDARLRAKAEERLKAINAAYHTVVACRAGTRIQGPRPDEAPRRPDAVPTPNPQPARPWTAGPVRNRHVRMPLPRVEVRLGGRVAWLTDLSLTGGQLLLDFAPIVGSDTTLLLQVRRQALELEARVIRVVAAASARQADALSPPWIASVTFLNVEPHVQQAIPRFYNLLLDASRRTT